MSLQIYLAHTGQRLQADPISFASPDALKSWIANETSISTDRQILITGRGKNVRQQNLLTETDVFVYDKKYISPSGGDQPPATPAPQSLDLQDPPTILANQTSLQAWRDLFKARQAWATELSDLVGPYRDSTRRGLEEADIIQRASALALDNLQSHIRNIQNRFEDTRAWAAGLVEDHENMLRDWKSNVQILGRVPAKNDFAFLLQGPRTPTKRKSQQNHVLTNQATLRIFIDEQAIERAASGLMVASHELKGRLQEIDAAMGDVSTDTRRLETDIRSGVDISSSEDVHSLYAEVEMLTKMIGADYDDLLRLADGQKSVQTAARRALIHTRDLLPSLQKVAAGISDLADQATNRRNMCLEASTRALRTISIIQSGLGDLQSRISNLSLSSEGMEAYDVVQSVFELPTAYGSTLIESIRRSEWAERLKGDGDRAVEELKAFTDEERRRRKKWMKKMGALINDVPEEIGFGIELSVLKPDDVWPSSSRQEVFEYMEALGNVQIDDAVQHITHLLKELESLKARRKGGQAFKNGSVYDAEVALGRSSLVLEDEEEETSILRDEKLKLEDKLRASDSRVRKLEDLLHRQSQLNRPASVNFGPPLSELDRPPQSPAGPPSPRPSELISRRSSVSSRRLSSNQNLEEKTLVQRIVGLEADLRGERDTVLKLQRESHADRRASTESRDRMNEAELVKKDLLANLDAQRQEFDDERQLLEDEMHKLKIRLEEVEDELDRVVGSRDHQRMTSDNTVVKLQTEMERLGKIAADEVAKAQGQADFIRNDFVFQRNRANSLERQLQQTKQDLSSLQSENLDLANISREQADARVEHISSLQAAHSHLSPAGSAPNDLTRLARAIEILSEGLAIHAQNAEKTAQVACGENISLREQIFQTESELQQAKTNLATEERETLTLRKNLGLEQAKLAAFATEYADVQRELSGLRAKFATGETGSEALKERVSEEEHKVADLTEKLAVADANTHSFEQEMSIWKDKVQRLTAEANQWKDRLDLRGVRAKDLSLRLLSHNDRIIRMLEQMGYSVSRQDHQLTIQRASKVNASIVLSNEMSAYMNQPLVGQSPPQHYSNASDLETLYWMSDSDAIAEDNRFKSFISTISRLDMESAVEMIAKRYKDIEVLARKYQKDSRAYREKAHRLQSEAHDKIAYRAFKEGDLALFLPTRNQVTRPWAAFNVGAPHYFLREQDIHRLQARDWLLARINKVEERVVDLSKSLANGHQNHQHISSTDRHSINTEVSDHGSTRSMDDENPFELSDGLRWYMIDAAEEKPGTVPVLTPGLGKSTVAATNIDAKGSIRLTKEGKKTRDTSGGGGAAVATKTLSKSLDSRRSSSNSKKGATVSPSMTSHPTLANGSGIAGEASSRPASSSAHLQQPPLPSGRVVKLGESDAKPDEQAREDAPIFEAGPERSAETMQSQRAGMTLSLSPAKGPGNALRRPQQQLQQQATNPRRSESASPTKDYATGKQRQTSPEKKNGWNRLWSVDFTFGE